MKSNRNLQSVPPVAHLHTCRCSIVVVPVVGTHRTPHVVVRRVNLQDEVGPVEANCEEKRAAAFSHQTSQQSQHVQLQHLTAVSFIFSVWTVPDSITPLRAAQTRPPTSTWSPIYTLVVYCKHTNSKQ